MHLSTTTRQPYLLPLPTRRKRAYNTSLQLQEDIHAEFVALPFDSRGGKKLETAVRRETGESASQIWSGNKSGRGGPVDAVHEACESLSDG